MKNAGVSCSSKCPDSVHGAPLESREAADLEKEKKIPQSRYTKTLHGEIKAARRGTVHTLRRQH